MMTIYKESEIVNVFNYREGDEKQRQDTMCFSIENMFKLTT